ncbi:MAG: 3-oxoadipate enol-lactonase [Cumulibacter sp.]
MAHPLLAWSEDGTADGPPVLMGSSLGATRAMWDPGLGTLNAMRVIRFDHLGHGASAVPPGPYSMQQLADAVLQLMDHLGIERASYAGLSLGGALGQYLAIHHPERIERLALLATAAHFPDEASWRERAAAVRRDGTAAVADGAMPRWFPDSYRAQHPGAITQWLEMIRSIDAEGYAGCCEALAGFDTRDALGAITAPTIAIAGADDPSTTPETMRVLAAGISGARLEVIDNAAHLVNVAQPEQVGALLAAHLNPGQ